MPSKSKTKKHILRKDKTAKKGSIAKRLTIAILKIVFVSVLVSNILAIHIAKKDMKEIQGDVIKAYTVSNTRAFSDHFSDEINRLQGLAQIVDLNEAFTDTKVQEKLQYIYKSSHFLNLYYVKQNADLIAFGDQINITKAKNIKFFGKALGGEVDIINPYVDALTGEYCITIAVPHKDSQGNVDGAFCVDLATAELSEYLSEISVGENGYSYIVSNSMDIVAHKDSTKANKNLNELVKKDPGIQPIIDIAQKAFVEGSAKVEYTINGNKMYSEIQKIDGTNWIFVSSAYRSEVQKRVNVLIRNTFISGAILFLVIASIGYLTGKKLGRPISDIARYFDRFRS